MQARRLIRRAATLAAALFVTSAAWAGDFSSSYSAGLLTTYSIKGTEPASGKHPVFIYTVGTTEDWDNGQAMAAVAEMAAKGFVAAAVQYDSALFGTCSQILSKAKYIYNSASSSSAVSKLCARATADCSKGIVAAGFSQGSVIAINSKNYDARVRAAYGMGAHNLYTTYVLNSCMNNGNHTLAVDQHPHRQRRERHLPRRHDHHGALVVAGRHRQELRLQRLPVPEHQWQRLDHDQGQPGR